MLTAAYPQARVTEPTSVLWAKALTPFELEDGMDAAELWITSEERFPPISRVVELARGLVRRRHEATADRRGLAGPSLPAREQMTRLMGETRRMLAGQERVAHWHGTPGVPCDACGGMKPVNEQETVR